MMVYKFSDFVNEKVYDSPHGYIKARLLQIEQKIKDIFQTDFTEEEEVESFTKRNLQDKKKDGKISFDQLGITEYTIQKSNYSKIQDNVRVRFFDEDFMYDLIFFLDLKDGVPKATDKDFKLEDIKDCFVKFKKYDQSSFELLAQIPPKTIEIDKLSSDLLIELKIEIDESSPSSSSGEAEFEIETE